MDSSVDMPRGGRLAPILMGKGCQAWFIISQFGS